jgi:hypothetical protein
MTARRRAPAGLVISSASIAASAGDAFPLIVS